MASLRKRRSGEGLYTFQPAHWIFFSDPWTPGPHSLTSLLLQEKNPRSERPPCLELLPPPPLPKPPVADPAPSAADAPRSTRVRTTTTPSWETQLQPRSSPTATRAPREIASEVHRRLEKEEAVLVVLRGSTQPFALLGQLYDRNSKLCLWEWIFLPHQFTKTIVSLPELLTKLCYKGRTGCWELAGVDPAYIYLPLTSQHLEQLLIMSLDFQIALSSFMGEIKIHYPPCKFIQNIDKIPLNTHPIGLLIPFQTP
ncbi:uncharacterized protein LOC126638993 [Myiozetetes cayanensis]|uniref:uncharacterized protein LOC126638993 n=1 Tax=Myiozetetes cayanensis TaxID=478635 RepID=UPI00215F18F9|nr:uncharacterized protein LOC126638993 [Myiozetetes cayanensis]